MSFLYVFSMALRVIANVAFFAGTLAVKALGAIASGAARIESSARRSTARGITIWIKAIICDGNAWNFC
jgi:hypothetical protein